MPKLIHTQWFSHSENISRHVDIYIPKGCEEGCQVLYLIHGINGYEGAWSDKGFAPDTLESMMATGRCGPIILVMPDCNKWPIKERPVKHGNLWKCVVHYPRLSHEHEIEHAISDLIDMVDTTYNVSTCLIAGLSDGGRIAANVANVRPDRVRTVALFSPVLHEDQLPKDSTQAYYVYVGKDDMFYANGKRFHKRMMKKGYPHEWIEQRGHHNWRMWRKCLANFLERAQPANDQNNHSDSDNQ